MPPDSVEPSPSFNPSDSAVVRRSSLLGQRKAHPHPIDKPQAFARMERPHRQPTPAIEPSSPPPELPAEPDAPTGPAPTDKKSPTRARRSKRASQPTDPLILLTQKVETLAAALSDRPSWDDLRALELRLTTHRPDSRADSQELTHLQEQLQTRQEELEELSAIVAEFQEQSDQAKHRLLEMEGAVQSLRQQLNASETSQRETEHRLRQSEGFLQEALLGLLSPGDEFNEDLVEQIQHFLAL